MSSLGQVPYSARHSASRIEDLPAPVSPVMANSPAERSGSAVKSISKASARLAMFWPLMVRMRIGSDLGHGVVEGRQMAWAGVLAVGLQKGGAEQILGRGVGQTGRV